MLENVWNDININVNIIHLLWKLEIRKPCDEEIKNGKIDL
jgi:hypothetical protein